MKTFIYLPLIALIILSSCKSNSFTTQRYTKFGHASHKKQTHEQVVKVTGPKETKAETRVESEVVKAKITPVTIITTGVSTLKQAILKPERKIQKLNASIALEEAAAPSYSDSKVANDIKPSFNSKKQVKHEGLIGSAFLTALWIVLVVIFICLIIFLLSAIF